MDIQADFLADMGIDMVSVSAYDFRDFIDTQSKCVQAAEAHFHVVQPEALQFLDKGGMIQGKQEADIAQDFFSFGQKPVQFWRAVQYDGQFL